MLRRFFTRALTTLNSPTADLYFANACADWLAAGDVVRYAPTVFASPTTRLVIRHDARSSRSSRRERLIYVIDDAVDLEGADEALSPYWRFKLNVVERAAAAAFLPNAAGVVVSSEALKRMIEARAPDQDVRVMNPYWSEPFSDLSHHAGGGLFRVAYLGSQVHGPDFAPLAPVLVRFLEERPNAELIVGGGHAATGPLAGHARVRDIGPMAWADYRRALGDLDPHVALYPLQNTPFNAARSLNKLIEHAVAGAAGLYATQWPGAAIATQEGAGLALRSDPTEWLKALETLADDRGATALMAERSRVLARRLNDRDAQRRIWSELLETPGFD